jgi:hypothetical protein
MYKVRGIDQKEYGPVNIEQLKSWIAQGRVQEQTLAQGAEGEDWNPLSAYPEFSEALAAAPAAATPGPIRPAPLPTAPAGPPPKTSGMAITSLILGVLGCLGITAIAGLILGIMSLVRIKNSQGRLGGQGLAIAGICVSAIMLLFCVPFIATTAGLTLPALAKAKSKAQTINCVSNMKQIGLAVRIYASDRNDTFPPAETWNDAIQQNVGNPKVFQCPGDRGGQRSSYGYNAKLSGLKEDKVSPQTVMIFECRGGWNFSGGPQDVLTHHGNTHVVGFVDGSVQQVSAARLSTLRWEP